MHLWKCQDCYTKKSSAPAWIFQTNKARYPHHLVTQIWHQANPTQYAAKRNNWGGTLSKFLICDTARDTQTEKRSFVRPTSVPTLLSSKHANLTSWRKFRLSIMCIVLNSVATHPRTLNFWKKNSRNCSCLFLWKMEINVVIEPTQALRYIRLRHSMQKDPITRELQIVLSRL